MCRLQIRNTHTHTHTHAHTSSLPTFSYSRRIYTNIDQLPTFVQEQTELSHKVDVADDLLDRLRGVRNDVVISMDLYGMVSVLSRPLVFWYVKEQLDSNN